MDFISLTLSVDSQGRLVAFEKLFVHGVEKRNDINGHLFWLYK